MCRSADLAEGDRRLVREEDQGLNNFQKSVLRKRWATMEELMSAGERKQRIIARHHSRLRCASRA
jgi:hypothetical protein